MYDGRLLVGYGVVVANGDSRTRGLPGTSWPSHTIIESRVTVSGIIWCLVCHPAPWFNFALSLSIYLSSSFSLFLAHDRVELTGPRRGVNPRGRVRMDARDITRVHAGKSRFAIDRETAKTNGFYRRPITPARMSRMSSDQTNHASS